MMAQRRLASVYAHPDDDTYSTGGVVALEGASLQYTVVVATSGEAGTIADPALATRENLAEVREAEERAALAALGANGAVVHFLRFPDGGLAGVPRDRLVERVADVLRPVRPQVVVTFGPEGVTKHPDHVAIHQAATEAFHLLQTEGDGRAYRRLFYNAIPQSTLERFSNELSRSGVDAGTRDDPNQPRGVPDHTITVRVDCRAVWPQKLDALRAHRTQALELEAIPERLRQEVLGTEWFVQAWPPVTEPRGAIADSLFHGLEE